MKKACLHIIILLHCMVFIPAITAVERGHADLGEKIYFNREFFDSFKNIPSIMRDGFWNEKMNAVITARGGVVSIERKERYKRKYRIVIKDTDAENSGLSFTYYVFIEKQDSFEMLSEKMRFEFSGQLMTATPLSVSRDAYIFDIILEKGAMLVE